MATKKWFVLVGEDEMGPLGPNGLRKLVRKGEVKPDTLVRREDHERAVPAGRLRGLFADEIVDELVPLESGGTTHHGGGHGHHRSRNKIHGPFASLRTLGWVSAAAFAAFALVGLLGIYTALQQRSVALRIVGGEQLPLTDAGAPFLGLGGVVAGFVALAAGVVFVYWLWLARVNLPHLINARIHFAPGWTVAAWLVPILNLLRPFEVLSEVDRLSAEADADGDANVRGNRLLLASWWAAVLLGVGLALAYVLQGPENAAAFAAAAQLHLAAAACVVIAAILAAVIVVRISLGQEHAHDTHPEPVELHHEFGRGNHVRHTVTA